jgi:hypothetical protein
MAQSPEGGRPFVSDYCAAPNEPTTVRGIIKQLVEGLVSGPDPDVIPDGASDAEVKYFRNGTAAGDKPAVALHATDASLAAAGEQPAAQEGGAPDLSSLETQATADVSGTGTSAGAAAETGDAPAGRPPFADSVPTEVARRGAPERTPIDISDDPANPDAPAVRGTVTRDFKGGDAYATMDDIRVPEQPPESLVDRADVAEGLIKRFADDAASQGVTAAEAQTSDPAVLDGWLRHFGADNTVLTEPTDQNPTITTPEAAHEALVENSQQQEVTRRIAMASDMQQQPPDQAT